MISAVVRAIERAIPLQSGMAFFLRGDPWKNKKRHPGSAGWRYRLSIAGADGAPVLIVAWRYRAPIETMFCENDHIDTSSWWEPPATPVAQFVQ